MEQLWSPWRSQYIQTFGTDAENDECFLCAAGRLPAESEQRLVVARGKTCCVVMNKYPYNSGHLLVAPYRHIGEMELLTPDELTEMMLLLRHSSEVLREIYSPHGMNIGANLGRAAGAGVPGHLHFHLVPRWNGDTNFMPVFADIKVIPEALETSYDKLKTIFDGLK